MEIDALVLEKIDAYNPVGGLVHTTKSVLMITEARYPLVKKHLERVGLYTEAVAKRLEKDTTEAFFGGLLHDFGKIALPPELFTDREITDDEYEKVKAHARIGFEMLKNSHISMALYAGLHHAIHEAGYEFQAMDLPVALPLAAMKKILEISLIISICDFIDTSKYRHTELKKHPEFKNMSLREMLLAMYRDCERIIDIALAEAKF